MKSKYQASVREINGKAHFIIKKFNFLPELPEAPDFLVSMGMHHDFLKACDLAGVGSDEVKDQLMTELGLRREADRIVSVHELNMDPDPKPHSIFRFPHDWLSKLGLAHI